MAAFPAVVSVQGEVDAGTIAIGEVGLAGGFAFATAAYFARVAGVSACTAVFAAGAKIDAVIVAIVLACLAFDSAFTGIADFTPVARMAADAAVADILIKIEAATGFAAGFIVTTFRFVWRRRANTVEILAGHAVGAVFIDIAVAIEHALFIFTPEFRKAISVFVGEFCGFLANRACGLAFAIIAVLGDGAAVEGVGTLAFLTIKGGICCIFNGTGGYYRTNGYKNLQCLG